jgi:hypothetical protein
MSKSLMPTGTEAAGASSSAAFPKEAFQEVVRFIKGKHRTSEEDLPKVRTTEGHYETLGVKDGGVNDGIRVRKTAKASHADRDDRDASHPYYRETIVKKYLSGFTVSDSGSFVIDDLSNIERSIQELTALHMINLANYGLVEPSKAMIISNGGELPETAVRFHKDFQTIESLQRHNPEKLAQIDAGAALAQSFWIGDIDGHSKNLGTIGDSTRATRIDFDLAFSSKIGDIINFAATEERTDYPLFADSLSRKSFAEELEKLSNMDYQDSPQFAKLLDIVFASYEAHLGHPIDDKDKKHITTKITDSLKQNGIEMKFLAQIAKINVILKENPELNESHIEQIKTCTDRLATLRDEYPASARSALRNVGNIFGIANIESERKRQVIDMVADPEIQKTLRDGLSGESSGALKRVKDKTLHRSLISIASDLKRAFSSVSSGSAAKRGSARSSSRSSGSSESGIFF